MKRLRLKTERVLLKSGGSYFEAPTPVSCISTGCRLLDRVLGGGFAEGRTGNIVGDTSTGKTLLAIETCANFVLKYPTAKEAAIRYAESEAAFDIPYAKSVGLPEKRIQFNKGGVLLDTVEDWYEDLEAFCDHVEGVKFVGYAAKKGKEKESEETDEGESSILLKKVARKTKPILGRKPLKAGLYILDSCDALSDEDEKASKFGKDSYGGKKPKLIGQLFRRIIRRLEKLNITMLVVSQVRAKIGVSFGKKISRSGGKALDFYSSQIIWLSDLGKIEETKAGIKRKVGTWTRVKCEKNKVGIAFRDCDLVIRYAYGIDEFDTALQWFIEVKRADVMGFPESGKAATAAAREYLKSLNGLDADEMKEERRLLNEAVDKVWFEIERKFLPTRSKYS